jgi:hypothetical protein
VSKYRDYTPPAAGNPLATPEVRQTPMSVVPRGWSKAMNPWRMFVRVHTAQTTRTPDGTIHAALSDSRDVIFGVDCQ